MHLRQWVTGNQAKQRCLEVAASLGETGSVQSARVHLRLRLKALSHVLGQARLHDFVLTVIATTM
jgi:hypothetical protein